MGWALIRTLDARRAAVTLRSWLRLLIVVCVAGLMPQAARAHVGSKDVFEQVQAGPYKLFVTIRPPVVIPGVAEVEARSAGAEVSGINIAPVPLTGEAAKHPPTPDSMKRSADDPTFYTGSLWLMAPGSWQVRIQMDGAAGHETAGVPVAAAALSVKRMQGPLGALLALLGVVLMLGMTGIVAAAIRESRLTPGEMPSSGRRRAAVIAGLATLALMIAAVLLGNKWWNVEAAGYAADIYHPSDLHATLRGDRLTLEMGTYDKEKKQWVSNTPGELLPDHEHLMHLYAIRWPEMDAAFHLHPEPVPETDALGEELPALPPGTYRLFGDIVHHSGFPETLTAVITIPQGLAAAKLANDDAGAMPPPVSAGELGTVYKLPDGYTMVWDRPATIEASKGYDFRFRLLDAAGRPAQDVVPYMGMAGHAAWVKTDGSVFAHTHPQGSAAMPAVMLAEEGSGALPALMEGKEPMGDMENMAGMNIPPSVEFPYGLPSPGRYRVFIQMKHSGTIETGVFDADVR